LNARALKVFPNTRRDCVTLRVSAHRVAVAAAGGEPAGRAKTQTVNSSTCSILYSPVIELSLIIYGEGAKRNKQLSRLRPETLRGR
jgi:hypothetical protein